MSRVFTATNTDYLASAVSDPGGILDPTSNAFTFGGWVKISSSPAASWILWAKWNGTTGWLVFIQSSGVVRAQINTTNTDDSGSLSTGSWYHLMVRRDASTLKLYRDGSEVGSNGSPASLSNTTHSFYWGHRTSGTTIAPNGLMAEFAAWSAILTVEEIAALAKGASPFKVRPSSLVYQPGWGVGAVGEPDLGGTGITMNETGTVAVDNHPPVGCPFPLPM